MGPDHQGCRYYASIGAMSLGWDSVAAMAKPIHVVNEGDSTYFRALAEVRTSKPALLCGSAISIFEPTSIQSGYGVTSDLARKLCHAAHVSEKSFGDLVRHSAFEVLLDVHPRKAHLAHLFATYFIAPNGRPARINQLHKAIASSLERGLFSNVITTNYDTCIEACFGGRRHPGIIIRRDDSLGPSNILKLHGSADDPRSLIFALSQESTMRDWKRDKLRLLCGDALIVMGYSGADFEVCPELYQLPLRHLYWVALPDHKTRRPLLSAHSLALLRHHPSTVINADMQTVLRDLTGRSIRNAPIAPTYELSTRLMNCLSESQQRLWAGLVFVALSAPTAVASAIREEQKARSPKQLSYTFKCLAIDGEGHAGRYFDVSQFHRSQSANRSLTAYRRVSHCIKESGAFSMGANDAQAIKALNRGVHLSARSLAGRKREKTLHGLRWMKLLIERDKLTSGTPTNRHIAKLRRLYADAMRDGNYGLAGLCSNEIKEIGGEAATATFSPILERSAAELFQHIGNYVGQVTALRDRVRRSMSRKLARRLRAKVKFLRRFGLYPELWRVYYTLIHFEPTRLAREGLYAKFENTLDLCQFDAGYTAQMKALARIAVATPKITNP